MTVWIVNPFDNLPAEGCRPQRYWLMAEAFAAAGHDVTLWTQDWSHARKSRRRMCAFDAPFGVRQIHVPGYGRNICLKRIWSHWRFAKNWASQAMRTTGKPQLVIVSSPPLFIGAEVRRFCADVGAKYVVDIMDAWPETFERVVPAWSLFWMRSIAAGNCRAAAGITAVTKSYLELAERRGAKCPMHLCYHGIRMMRGAGEAARRERPGRSTVRLVYTMFFAIYLAI